MLKNMKDYVRNQPYSYKMHAMLLNKRDEISKDNEFMTIINKSPYAEQFAAARNRKHDTSYLRYWLITLNVLLAYVPYNQFPLRMPAVFDEYGIARDDADKKLRELTDYQKSRLRELVQWIYVMSLVRSHVNRKDLQVPLPDMMDLYNIVETNLKNDDNMVKLLNVLADAHNIPFILVLYNKGNVTYTYSHSTLDGFHLYVFNHPVPILYLIENENLYVYDFLITLPPYN